MNNMICTIRNSFEDLDAMRGYFKGLPSFGSPASVNVHTWLLTDYFQIRQVLNDPSTFKAYDFRERLKRLMEIDPEKYGFSSVSEAAGAWLIFMEGERHLSYKRQLHKSLYELDLDAIIRKCTDQILTELEGRSSFDLMTDFCDPLITRIVCVMLGIDVKYCMVLRQIVKNLLYAFEPFVGLEGMALVGKAHDALVQFLNAAEQDSSLSQKGMLQELSSRKMPNGMSEAVALMEFLMFAGIETSTILFCESIYRLMTDLTHEVPGLYRDDRRDLMIEELIRMGSATSVIARVAQTAVTLEGNPIKAGDILLLSLASANRDPRCFAYPDIIHPDNLKHQHLAFGSGKHYCLGTSLSRLEMQIILPAFFSRIGSRCRIPENERPVISKRYFLPGIEKLTIQVNEP